MNIPASHFKKGRQKIASANQFAAGRAKTRPENSSDFPGGFPARFSRPYLCVSHNLRYRFRTFTIFESFVWKTVDASKTESLSYGGRTIWKRMGGHFSSPRFSFCGIYSAFSYEFLTLSGCCFIFLSIHEHFCIET